MIALFAAAAAAMLAWGAAAGYRFYENQQAETAADAIRARAYAETQATQAIAAEAKPATPAASKPRRHGTAPARRIAAGPPPATKPPKTAKPKPRATRPTAVARADAGRPAATPTRKAATAAARAPASGRAAARPENVPDVDRIYDERAMRECARGFVGLICREWLKASLCLKHGAYGKASVCPLSQPAPAYPFASVG